MFIKLTEEQKDILNAVQSFVKQEIAPNANKWDQDKIFPLELFSKAATMGLAGLNVSENNGGLSLDRLTTYLVYKEIAKACPCTAAYLSIHNMVTWVVDTYASEHVKDKYLGKMLSMEYLASYCLTEPNSGSDAGSLSTQAIVNDSHYKVTGQKSFISGAPYSQVYLCMARTGDGKHDISALLIDKDFEGVTFGAQEQKMGWNAQATAAVHLDSVNVPKEHLVGVQGKGFNIAMQALDRGRLSIAACSLGGAEACLDSTKQYMLERHQFGKKLSEFQSLQFKIANMRTELESAKLLVANAAMAVDNDESYATSACAMAKMKATDVGFNVVNECMQLHGGYGYLKDYQVERYLRDLRVHQILEGTNEIMKLIISRHEFTNQ